jgi:hypothetical protein
MKPFDSIRKSIRSLDVGARAYSTCLWTLHTSKALNNVSSKASVTSSSSVGKSFSLVKYGFRYSRGAMCQVLLIGDEFWLDRHS